MKLTRGERFRDARANMAGSPSLRTVAQLSGVQYGTIQALEDDENDRGVSYREVMRLAEFYNVSIDYLLCVTNTPTRDATTQAICQATGFSEKAISKFCESTTYNELPESLKQKAESMDISKETVEKFLQGYVESNKKLVKVQNKLFEANGYWSFLEELANYLEIEKRHEELKEKVSNHPLTSQKTEDVMEQATESEETMKEFISLLDVAKEEEKAKEKAEYKCYKLNQSFQKLIEEIVSKELERESYIREIKEEMIDIAQSLHRCRVAGNARERIIRMLYPFHREPEKHYRELMNRFEALGLQPTPIAKDDYPFLLNPAHFLQNAIENSECAA